MTIPRSSKENSSSSTTSSEFVKVSSPIPVSSHKKFDDRHRRSLRRSSRFEKQSIRLRRGKSSIILNLLSKRTQSEDGQDENDDVDDDINPRRKRIRKQLISGDNDQVMLMCNSSDTSSPSYSFFTNQSSFDLFYDTTDIDSISADSTSFFLSVDGSKINPIEDACLVLHESSENLVLQGKEGATSTDKDEIVVWLVNSPKSSTNDLVQVGSSSDDILSHVLNSNETLSKTANDIQEVDTDGPLFWPSERKLDWSSSDKWDLIVISPRKNGDIVISSPRKNGEIVISPHKNGEIVISPRANGKIVITPRKNGDLVITPRRNGGKPQGTSGLARSNSSVRFSFNKRKTEVKVDEPKKKILSRSKSEVSAAQLEGKTKAENKMKSKLLEIINENNPFFGGLLEESDCIVPSNDFSIEKLVGLDEFDGHEGVEGNNGNKGDYFFLDVTTNGLSRSKSNILKYSRSSSQKVRSERKRSRGT
ncbi:uncharacterized protein LOC113360687 [Papaver somniferum]|uniref:uncharacterized protein LOC113360687 n=1 Tax=Papaver somniferum TaxID=3469 RepID=UPI000E6FECAF|nr:uncharacterized protein LOC113360687 [Papaver somniferum]